MPDLREPQPKGAQEWKEPSFPPRIEHATEQEREEAVARTHAVLFPDASREHSLNSILSELLPGADITKADERVREFGYDPGVLAKMGINLRDRYKHLTTLGSYGNPQRQIEMGLLSGLVAGRLREEELTGLPSREGERYDLSDVRIGLLAEVSRQARQLAVAGMESDERTRHEQFRERDVVDPERDKSHLVEALIASLARSYTFQRNGSEGEIVQIHQEELIKKIKDQRVRSQYEFVKSLLNKESSVAAKR